MPCWGVTIILNFHQWDPVSADQDFQHILDAFPVSAIFAGHIHEKYGRVGSAVSKGIEIPVYLSGSVEYGTFLKVHFKDSQKMEVCLKDIGSNRGLNYPEKYPDASFPLVVLQNYSDSVDPTAAQCATFDLLPANQPPVARCLPREGAQLFANPVCVADVSIDAGSYDPDGDPITLGQAPVGPYPLGLTDVTLTVTDSHGATATCRSEVMVRDTTGPPLTCLPVTTECRGAGTYVSFTPTLGADNCGMAQFTGCTPSSGSGFGLGSTSVSCGAKDGGGNTSSCSFSVNIVDTTAPTLTCPSNQTATATSSGGASVSFSPTAFDGCTPPSVSCTPASGSTFPVGSTPVSCTATDGAANQNSCGFTVTVTATALMQTTALIATVDGLPVPPAVKLVLKAPLLVAKVALQHNQPQIACGSLRVFEGIVRQLRQANKLTAAQASQLTTALQSIRAAIGCP